MPKQPVPLPSGTTSRAEKMSILSTLLGPEALAKLRKELPNPAPDASDEAVESNADRAAWHRNKLLERLRGQSSRPDAPEIAPSSDRQPIRRSSPSQVAQQREVTHSVVETAHQENGLDMRLAAIADPDTFDQEHPAVIARLLKILPQQERIIALKALPGPIARSIVRRLR